MRTLESVSHLHDELTRAIVGPLRQDDVIHSHAVGPHAQLKLEVVAKEGANRTSTQSAFEVPLLIVSEPIVVAQVVELGQELFHVRVDGEAIAPCVLDAVEETVRVVKATVL